MGPFRVLAVGLVATCCVAAVCADTAPEEETPQPSDVVDLSTTSIDDLAAADVNGGGILLEIYAPWCGHCKALAPVYERLARTLKAEGSAVTVAKMDGTGNREAMERLGANSYPSIYFVRNGNQFHKYALARDEPSLLMYAKEGALALPDSEWTTLPPAPTIVDKVLETWTDKKNALACVFSAGVTVGGVITYVLML